MRRLGIDKWSLRRRAWMQFRVAGFCCLLGTFLFLCLAFAVPAWAGSSWTESTDPGLDLAQSQLTQGLNQSIEGAGMLAGGLFSGTLDTVNSLEDGLRSALQPSTETNETVPSKANPQMRSTHPVSAPSAGGSGVCSLVNDLASGLLGAVNDLVDGLNSALQPLNGIAAADSDASTAAALRYDVTAALAALSDPPRPDNQPAGVSRLPGNNAVTGSKERRPEEPPSAPFPPAELLSCFGSNSGSSTTASGTSSTASNGGNSQAGITTDLMNPVQLPLTGYISEIPDPLRLPPFIVLFSPPG
ncbi:MAG: hypothetical protein QME76_05460 [Bacillota bacterium]|nr:hypothetical protein [Bacillota bacterium]